MDRIFPFFAAFFPLLLILPILAAAAQQPASMTQSVPLSDDVAKRVRVIIDPIRVLVDQQEIRGQMVANNSSGSCKKGRPVCVLALHRDQCQGPRIRSSERIGWQDRLCFVWHCLCADGLAMRVQDCWAGSEMSPILLIDQAGCTRESSMLSTPQYRPLNQSAHSLGWLTVRLSHLDHIRLSCAIKFCPLCDPECRQEILPTKCADSTVREGDGEQWWAKELEQEEREGEGRRGLQEICSEKAVKEGATANGATGRRNGMGGQWALIFGAIIWALLMERWR